MSKILGDRLSSEMTALLNAETVNAVLATNSPDGYPHTTPLYLIKVKSPGVMRICLAKAHQAAANLSKDGRLMISVLYDNDAAYSIKGKASIWREAMNGNSYMCAFEVAVEEIKSDTTPTVMVESGVRTKYRSEKTESFFKTMFAEIAE